MEHQVKFEGQIECISVLRVVGALGIALYHIGTFNDYIATPQAGVSLFFCISAFLMMYTTQNGSPDKYILKRLIRIVPLYWIMTVFTFAAMQVVPSISTGGGTPEFIKSLFFVPYLRHALKSADVVRPMVGPAWTLYYDVYFTIIFGISMKINHKYRGLIAGLCCVALLMTEGRFGTDTPFLFILCKPWWISFAVGIGAFYIIRYLWNKYWKTGVDGVLIGLTLVAFGLMFTCDLNIYRNAVLSGVALICLVLACKKRPMPKAINFLGKISFSFYLIHYYVVLIVGRFVDLKIISAKSICAICLILVISILLAGISNYLVEDKLSQILKKKLCKT